MTTRGSEPGAADHGQGWLANSISNAVVRLYAQYLGRGPTKAETVVSRDMVVVVLQDTLTKAERSLVAGGQTALVREIRRAFQPTMGDEMVRAVEALAGRRVVALLSDQITNPDYAVEAFVMEALPEEGDA